MRGRLYVHPNEDDFRAWLRYQLKAQNSHEPETHPGAAGTPVASAYNRAATVRERAL